MTATLIADGVTKWFDRARAAAVCDATLHAAAGDLVVVAGSHGSGRTTLVRCLAGSYRPDDGTIVVREVDGAVDLAGADPRQLAWLRRHALSVFDGAIAAPPRRSAVEVLAREAAISPERATDALRRLGWAEVADVPLGRLRSDATRAVALAAALAKPAPVVLLDEPDESSTDGAVRQWIRERCADGAAVVATARPDSALEADASTVGVMDEGVLRWQTV
jgi:alpha-D-ribose 1-methylphosphonate 5-triphosphate synthase subunit PhnL